MPDFPRQNNSVFFGDRYNLRAVDAFSTDEKKLNFVKRRKKEAALRVSNTFVIRRES